MKKIDEKQLIELVAKALGINKKIITLNSSNKNLKKWDSLGHLNILVSLDKKLKGKTQKIVELSQAFSIQKIKKILIKKALFK